MNEKLATSVRNCLMGAAIGNALGEPFQHISVEEDSEVIESFAPLPRVRRGITAEGQLLSFTVEGLIRASIRARTKGICDVPSVLWHSYLRWMTTQGLTWKQVGGWFAEVEPKPDGWLVYDKRMRRRRGPEPVTFGSLASQVKGDRHRPINNADNDGALLRCVPPGFLEWSEQARLDLARDLVAITHGASNAWEAGAALTAIIASLLRGEAFERAVQDARDLVRSPLREHLDADLLLVVDYSKPVDLAGVKLSDGASRTLLFALSAALKAGDDFFASVEQAVGWDGHSATSAAVCGALVGAAGGDIPDEFVTALPQAPVIEMLAADFCLEHSPKAPDDKLPTVLPLDGGPAWSDEASPPRWWWLRYPGW